MLLIVSQNSFWSLVAFLSPVVFQLPSLFSFTPNKELKGMVEAYKTRPPQEKAAEPQESAREKMDALVKDTAAKLSPEKTPKAKAKAKAKAKKVPEL